MQQGHSARKTIASDGNLVIIIMKLVKGVEKAFLGLLFTTNKVDVINQQHINISVFVPEILSFSTSDSDYELISIMLSANIEGLGITGLS
ncbi:hypothetical protein ES703_112374 [subsurface metagenome]